MRLLSVLCLSDNVGDTILGSPISHYPLKQFEPCHIDNYRPQPDDVVIFGGGGMGHYPDRFAEILPRIKLSVSWAIGSNTHDANGYVWHRVLEDFTLCSTRDRHGVGTWVPCPTCKLSFFDNPPAASKDVVIASHKDVPIGPHVNRGDTLEWLRQLASGKKVITNTYHAIYWSILLGREVVMVSPWSSKFYGLPWPVPVAATVEDARNMSGYKANGEYELLRCRKANDLYYYNVRQLLDKELNEA